MDSITSKYVVLAVGILVVVIIVTAVVGALNNVGGIYAQTQKTNISIKDRTDNIFNKYDNATLNGVDLVNALKRYEDDSNVEFILVPEIVIPVGARMSVAVKSLMDSKDPDYGYHTLFESTVTIDGTGKYIITFEAI